MVTGKCTDVFRGIFGLGGELRGVTWEDIYMEELLMGEENFNEGGAGFSRYIWKNNENKYEKFFLISSTQ